MAAGGVGLEVAVPDTLDAVPPGLVTVEYTGGLKLETGGVLTPTQVKDVPSVSWGGEEGVLYTLMLVDPDAPSPADPKLRHWLHWLVVNIPGNSLAAGDQLFQYVGSGPPPDTGLHRYVFIVLKQSGKIEYDGPKASSTQAAGRESWDNKAFIAKHSLVPLAANLYKAEWDEYVPKLYESLGIVL